MDRGDRIRSRLRRSRSRSGRVQRRPRILRLSDRFEAMHMKTSVGHIRLKRAYEPPEPSDGTRILIDRLWPRGIKKSDAAIDRWLRDIAPSTDLRRWFG